MKKLLFQALRFSFVGVFCFLLDYGLMIFLTECFEVDYLLSSTISYCISIIVNYLLSLKFVFKAPKENNKKIAFILFMIVSIVGLGINQALLWFTVDILTIHYMLAKVLTALIVTIYNFISKKMITEKHYRYFTNFDSSQ